MRANYWVMCLAAFALASCNINLPKTNRYVLNVENGAPKAGAALPYAVGIEALEPSGMYRQEGMAYRKSDFTIDYYTYDHWAATPDLLVAEAITAAVSGSGRFARVTSWPSGGEGEIDFAITGQLEEMFEDQRTKPWKAVVTVRWQVRSGKNDEILGAERMTESAEAKGDKPEEYAAAASEAVRKLATRLNELIEKSAVGAGKIQEAEKEK